jgi:hypothetical protein
LSVRPGALKYTSLRNKLECFPPISIFWPSLMFVGKARSFEVHESS